MQILNAEQQLWLTTASSVISGRQDAYPCFCALPSCWQQCGAEQCWRAHQKAATCLPSWASLAEIWAEICLESLPQNRLCSWTHGHSFAGLSGGNGCKGSAASSNLAAFGWHKTFPLMEPMIGSSLKSWLKKISTEINRKQSLQNQKFSQISRSLVEGRAGISVYVDIMISSSRCCAHFASSPSIASSTQEQALAVLPSFFHLRAMTSALDLPTHPFYGWNIML